MAHTIRCEHDTVKWFRAEPQVGISTDYWECQDCGATTHERIEDAEMDEDGYVTRWVGPCWPWQDEDDDDDDDDDA